MDTLQVRNKRLMDGSSYSSPVQNKGLTGCSFYSNSNPSNCFADDPLWEAAKRVHLPLVKALRRLQVWLLWLIKQVILLGLGILSGKSSWALAGGLFSGF